MGHTMDEKTVKLTLRKGVFFPPWLLLVAMVIVSLRAEYCDKLDLK